MDFWGKLMMIMIMIKLMLMIMVKMVMLDGLAGLAWSIVGFLWIFGVS